MFEDKLETTIQDTKSLPTNLKLNGTVNMSQKEMRMMMGRVYLERCQVTLYSDVLDIPEFLWENDMYEHEYQQLKQYLDFQIRVSVLEVRMQVLDDLLQLLNTLADSTHASHLELIIIYLIVIEVVVQIGWNLCVKDLNLLGWFPNGLEDEF